MSDVHPKLLELRGRIDELDEQIIRLLAARTEVVREVAAYKTDEASVRAPDRVQQVVDRVRALAHRHDLPPDLAERLYRLLIAELTALELDRLAGRGGEER